MIRDEILKKYPAENESILMILHDLQNNNPQNWLSEEDLKAVAAYLNTTLSSVLGVATYYTMYSVKPRGKFIIRLCNSPVCHIEGAEEVLSEIERVLGIKIGETTPDGLFTIEATECLGRCAAAPGMIVNEQFHGFLSKDRISGIINKTKI